MSHKGQKMINKIASNLRGNEFSMYGYFTTNTDKMRKFVKKENYIIQRRWLKKLRRMENGNAQFKYNVQLIKNTTTIYSV
ncbi:MAG: hypothetical protein ACRDD7_10460 [Peptostreptococcaceae bacterium]